MTSFIVLTTHNILKHKEENVFGIAKRMVHERLAANGLPTGDLNIELKNRRGVENHARDLIDLMLYVCGLTPDFPRAVLHTQSTYFEFVSKQNELISVTDPAQPPNLNCKCVNVAKTVMDKFDRLMYEYTKLKNYVLNIETVFGENFKVITKKMGIDDFESPESRTIVSENLEEPAVN